MSIFDTAAGRSDALTLAEIIEEEKLFEEYLTARAQQAAAEAQLALQNIARDPIKAARAKRAAAEANAALAAQQKRLAQAQRVVARIKAKRPTSGQIKRKRRKPNSRQSEKQTLSRRLAPTATQLSPRVKRSKRTAATGAAQVTTAPSPEKPTKRPRIQKKKTVRTKVSKNSDRKVNRLALLASSQTKHARQPRQTFRTKQAADIEKVVTTPPVDTIECGWCAARIRASSIRCRCGWQIPEAATNLPPLSLSITERTAIAGGSKITKSGKRR